METFKLENFSELRKMSTKCERIAEALSVIQKIGIDKESEKITVDYINKLDNIDEIYAYVIESLLPVFLKKHFNSIPYPDKK